VSRLGAIGEGAKVLVAWLLGTLLTATFTAGGSHGWSALLFVVIVVGGVLGGLLHALVVMRRSRESTAPTEDGGHQS
jgi:hypothetical protein